MMEPTVTHTVTREDGTTYEVAVPKRLVTHFRRLCTSMAKLLREVQTHAPEAGLYLADDSPHLMVGPSHIGRACASCQENILADGANWPRSSGGGW